MNGQRNQRYPRKCDELPAGWCRCVGTAPGWHVYSDLRSMRSRSSRCSRAPTLPSSIVVARSFNATTKSGTNQFHGGVFEFIRNNIFDARNYFATTKQTLKRNQFGGDLGGPVLIPASLPTAGTVPSSSSTMRGSACVRARSSTISFPPMHNVAATSAPKRSSILRRFERSMVWFTRTPFANNQIPTSRLSPQALAILNFVPMVNSPSGHRELLYRLRRSTSISSPCGSIIRSIRGIALFARWIYVSNREVDPNASPALGTAQLSSIGQDIACGCDYQHPLKHGERGAGALLA